MCGSMVDIQSVTVEIRPGKKQKKKQDTNIMSASATQGGHNNFWHMEAWRNLTWVVMHLSTIPEKTSPLTAIRTTLWNAELVHLIKVILFPRKVDGFVMAALRSTCGHYIFVLRFLSSLFFFFYSSPNLSGRRLDVYHTLAHGVALLRI